MTATPRQLPAQRRILEGQTGQLLRASTSKGPPQKISKKLLPKET